MLEMCSVDHQERSNRLNEFWLHQVKIFHSTVSSMRKRKIDTDATIVCGETEFYVHQIVLKGASPYFRRMLDSDFIERKTKCIDLSIIDENVIDFIIDFIYLSAPPNVNHLPFDLLTDLFKAAHLLELSVLADYVWNEVYSVKNVDNCLAIWKIGYLYNTGNIDKIVEFVIDHLSDVVKEKEFFNIHVEQLLSLLRKAKDNKFRDTDSLVTITLNWVRTNEKDRIQNLKQLLMEVDLRSVTTEFLKRLMAEEPLFYDQTDVMKLLVTTSLEAKEFIFEDATTVNDITTWGQNFYFFGYYYETHDNSYLKKSAMQIFCGKKEDIVYLPFLLLKRACCVRWYNHFVFIGGKQNGHPSKICVQYDPINNSAFFLPSLEYAVMDAKACVANDTLYVISTTSEKYLQIQFIKTTDTWKTYILEENIENVLSVANLNNTVYVLCEIFRLDKNYRLYFVNKDNECKNFYEVPFSYDLHSHLIVPVGQSICCFVFENSGAAICLIFKDGRWISNALPFHFTNEVLPYLKFFSSNALQSFYIVKDCYDFSRVSFAGKDVTMSKSIHIDVDLGLWKTFNLFNQLDGGVEYIKKFVKRYEIMVT